MDDSVLKQLSDVIETRKSMPAEKSYVASLHHKGLNKILEKNMLCHKMHYLCDDFF